MCDGTPHAAWSDGTTPVERPGSDVRIAAYPSLEPVQPFEYGIGLNPHDYPIPEPIKPLTPRQRAIVRAYFASGCRTKKTAHGLGISVTRVREVKAFAASKVYLGELEAECARTVVQARAAQILAPTLRP